MNRLQRRLQKHRAAPWDNWFTWTGLKLARKAGLHLDVRALARQFNQGTLAKHNRRITNHPELSQADIEAEVVAMIFSKPGGQYYPVISAKNQRWLAWLGLNPKKGYYANLFHLIKSLVKAGQAGLWEMCNYLFSNDIARRYRLNKGRQRNRRIEGPAFVQRETVMVYDKNAVTTADIDQIETQDLCQCILEIYRRMEKADHLVIKANLANTFEAGYRLLKNELADQGITTARGAKKRLVTLVKRYPELMDIKQALKS